MTCQKEVLSNEHVLKVRILNYTVSTLTVEVEIINVML